MTMTVSDMEDQTRFETDPYLLIQIDPTSNDDRSIGYESDKSVRSNISTNSLTANICIPVRYLTCDIYSSQFYHSPQNTNKGLVVSDICII